MPSCVSLLEKNEPQTVERFHMLRIGLNLLQKMSSGLIERSLHPVAVADQILNVLSFGIDLRCCLKGDCGDRVILSAKQSIPQTERIQRLLGIKVGGLSIAGSRKFPSSERKLFAPQEIMVLRSIRSACNGVLKLENCVLMIEPL